MESPEVAVRPSRDPTSADFQSGGNCVVGRAALPLFGHSPVLLAASALVFGVSFFAVVGSTTAFVRFNYPPAAWPVANAVPITRSEQYASVSLLTSRPAAQRLSRSIERRASSGMS